MSIEYNGENSWFTKSVSECCTLPENHFEKVPSTYFKIVEISADTAISVKRLQLFQRFKGACNIYRYLHYRTERLGLGFP